MDRTIDEPFLLGESQASRKASFGGIFFKLTKLVVLVGLVGLGYYLLQVSNLGHSGGINSGSSSSVSSGNFLSSGDTIQMIKDWKLTGTSGEVVFLNASSCVTSSGETCYANNVDGYYVTINFTSPSFPIPTFQLSKSDVIELLWVLPETPLRYLGATAYVKDTSTGVSVFSDVGETLNFVQIAHFCNMSSTNSLWGSMIRLLFSVSQEVNNLQFRDKICTLVIPIPGSPLTNLTDDSRREYESQSDPNATNFTVILRLTLPESQSTLDRYVDSINEFTAVRRYHISTRSNEKQFLSPSYLSRSFVSGELDSRETVLLFRSLVNQVIDTLYLSYPSVVFKLVGETVPWLGNINYTYAGGFACVNTSNDCQGAQIDSTYMRSRLNNVTSTSHFITIGVIHHDFLDTSFYSSMSLYKLGNAEDKNSGAGILSFLDVEQEGSALGYSHEKREAKMGDSDKDVVKNVLDSKQKHYDSIVRKEKNQGAGSENVGDDSDSMKKILQSFYVIQTGYSCLSKLPLSTRCKTFTNEQIAENSEVFMLGRTYANPGPDPITLLPDIVLHVTVDNES